jgi:hypothetical protein
MCSAWSGGGDWSAVSADSIALRWRVAEQLSCTRGASVRTSARSAAHGELHVWRVEAEGSWQRSEQRRLITLRAVGTDSGVVGTTPRRARAGENGRWAGCPGGFGPVL